MPNTAIPAGATHLLAFARASSGFDGLGSASVALVDLVQPQVAAQARAKGAPRSMRRVGTVFPC